MKSCRETIEMRLGEAVEVRALYNIYVTCVMSKDINDMEKYVVDLGFNLLINCFIYKIIK